MTRIDIAFVVQVLSQFMHKPEQSHWEAAIGVVRYIKNALGSLKPFVTQIGEAAYSQGNLLQVA